MKTLSNKKCFAIVAIYFLISFFIGHLIPDSLIDESNILYFELLIDFLTALIIFYLVKDELRGEFNIFKAELSANISRIFKTTLSIWFICEIISFVAVFIFMLFFNLNPENNTNSNTINLLIDQNVFVLALIAVIIGPFIEEVLFRGALFKLFSKISDEFAVVAVALLFALLHFQADFFAGTISVSLVPSLIAYLALSYCITNSYYSHRNIFVSIGVHGLYNLISIVLTLLFL